MALGLIGLATALGGGAQAMGRSIENRQAQQAALDLEKARDEAAFMRMKAVEEFKIQMQETQGRKIQAGAEGILAPRTEQVSRNLEEGKGYPGAQDFVRNESGITDLERTKASAQSAGNLGLISAQREYRQEAKDIESADYQKERNRIQDKYNQDRADKAERFQELQLKHMQASEGKADAAAARADKQAFRSGIQTLMSEGRKTIEDLQKQKAEASSPELAKVIDEQIATHTADVNRYAQALSDDLGIKQEPVNDAAGMQDVIFQGKVIGQAKTREEADAIVARHRGSASATPEQKPSNTPASWERADRLDALMKRRPSASAPRSEIAAWEAEYARLKAQMESPASLIGRYNK